MVELLESAEKLYSVDVTAELEIPEFKAFRALHPNGSNYLVSPLAVPPVDSRA